MSPQSRLVGRVGVVLISASVIVAMTLVSIEPPQQVLPPSSSQQPPDDSTENQEGLMLLGAIDSIPSNTTTQACEEYAYRNRAMLSDLKNLITTMDLCQQARVAVATEEMAALSYWQVGLNIIGVAMLGFTLWFTKRAATATEDTLRIAESTLEEAKATTLAANKSTDVTRETGRAQVRAYPSITKVECCINRTTGCLGVDIEYKNYGQSPWMHPRLHIEMSLSPDIRKKVNAQLDTVSAQEAHRHKTNYADLWIPKSPYLEGGSFPGVFVKIAIVGKDVFGNEIGDTYEVMGWLPQIIDPEVRMFPLAVRVINGSPWEDSQNTS